VKVLKEFVSGYRCSGVRGFEGRESEKSTSEIVTRRNRFEPSVCGRTRVAESSISKIRAPGLTEVSILTSRVAKSRGNMSHPIGRKSVTRSSLSGIQTSEVREGSPSTSRVAKSRENRSRPSKEDRWQQSRSRRSAEEIQDFGLANSEVRRVRAQELGAPSREVTKLRGAETAVGFGSREDRWIRNPIAYRAFGGSKVERGHFRLQKSRNAERQGSCGHVVEP
jgi:hypothetical protein